MQGIYIRFPGFKLKTLTLSYDDGVRQDKRLIEIMKKNGLKGTFNINSGYFSETYNGETSGRMTKREALDLYVPSGMEVAIHGYRHLSLDKVATPLAMEDIVTDRKELEKSFERVITGMAYANGAYNDEVVTLLQKAGVQYARTVNSTGRFDIPDDWLRLSATCHHNDPKLMELAKEFVEGTSPNGYYWNRKVQMFYLWGHSYEFDNDQNWDVIERFAEYVGNREDIWYAANGEIFEYLQAAERLEYSVDGSFVRNPTAIDVYIDFLDNRQIVPAGRTIRLSDGKVL